MIIDDIDLSHFYWFVTYMCITLVLTSMTIVDNNKVFILDFETQEIYLLRISLMFFIGLSTISIFDE